MLPQATAPHQMLSTIDTIRRALCSLCFSLSDLFLLSLEHSRHAPLQGFALMVPACLECLFPRSHPFRPFLKRYLEKEAPKFIPLKWQSSLHGHPTPFYIFIFQSTYAGSVTFYFSFLYYLLSSECHESTHLPSSSMAQEHSKCEMRTITLHHLPSWA